MIHQSHVVQLAWIEAVCSRASRDYIGRSDIFPDLRHRCARQKKLDLFGSFMGGKTNQLKPSLVEDKMQSWRAFAPVLVYLSSMGIFQHCSLYLCCNRAVLF